METRQIRTKFGPVEITDSDFWVAHNPLAGLPGRTLWVLVDIPRYSPIGWLQSIEDPDTCLALAPPESYGFVYPPPPTESLFGEHVEDTELLVMTQFKDGEDGRLKPEGVAMYPLCFDPAKNRFAQWVLHSERAYRTVRANQQGEERINLHTVQVSRAA